MNRKRRNVLHNVLDGLERLRDPIMDKSTALNILNDAKGKVEICMDEEQDSIDARPENLLWSTVTSNMQDSLSDLTDACGDLECAIDDCYRISDFDYQVIQSDICKTVHAINLAIYRR